MASHGMLMGLAHMRRANQDGYRCKWFSSAATWMHPPRLSDPTEKDWKFRRTASGSGSTGGCRSAIAFQFESTMARMSRGTIIMSVPTMTAIRMMTWVEFTENLAACSDLDFFGNRL